MKTIFAHAIKLTILNLDKIQFALDTVNRDDRAHTLDALDVINLGKQAQDIAKERLLLNVEELVGAVFVGTSAPAFVPLARGTNKSSNAPTALTRVWIRREPSGLFLEAAEKFADYPRSIPSNGEKCLEGCWSISQKQHEIAVAKFSMYYTVVADKTP